MQTQRQIDNRLVVSKRWWKEVIVSSTGIQYQLYLLREDSKLMDLIGERAQLKLSEDF